MNRRLLACVSTSLLLTACGGNSATGPSAPPPPNYAGTWSGTYTVTGCTQSGGMALANPCGLMGTTPRYSITLTQNGTSATGSFTLGSLAFPSTGGTILSDGSLALSATYFSDGITIITNWALHNSGNAITGTVTQLWQSTTLSGQANVAGTIGTAVHSAAVTAITTTAPRTIEGLAQAVGEEVR